MNWLVIGGVLITVGGLFFIFKKMGLNKGDLNKFKEKVKGKNKLTPEEKAFYKGEILLPIDSRDLMEQEKLSNSLEKVQDSIQKEKLINSINSIDLYYKEWNPDKRFDFEKNTMGIKEGLYKN